MRKQAIMVKEPAFELNLLCQFSTVNHICICLDVVLLQIICSKDSIENFIILKQNLQKAQHFFK